ncbi:MAG: S9 family peptidase [Candidatus Dormibacteria bacterium]
MSLPLTPEVLVYGVSSANDPQVSPDGRRIAYTLNRTDPQTKRGQASVWICGIDGGDARQLTDPGRRSRGARWSPDGSRIAFTSAWDDDVSLMVLELGAWPAEPLQLARGQGEITDVAWSPDARRIAFTTAVTTGPSPVVHLTTRLDYKFDGHGFVGEARRQVFLVDVATGSQRQLTSGRCDHDTPVWSPDGRWLAVSSPAEPGARTQLVLLDVTSGERRAASPVDCSADRWAWSPRGDRILYVADPDHSLQPDYFLYDLPSGATRRVTEAVDSVPAAATAGGAAGPCWLDEEAVLISTVRAGASWLEILDLSSGTTAALDQGPYRTAGMSLDHGRRRVVQSVASLSAVGEISVYDRDTKDRRTITSCNTALLTEHPPARWERFEVQRDRYAIESWLLLPPDFDPSRRYPVVVDVHGGPTGHYGYAFMAVQQCLATHGFVVVFPNIRGSTSYGRAFAQELVEDWGGGDFQDLMAVVDAVLERDFADAGRTGIFGYSYGGYMCSWAIGQTHRFQAAVCGAPLFDLESYWGTSDIGRRGIERFAGGPPHLRRDWYLAHSPSTFAHRAVTPTLIIQGEEDQRCPVGQGEQMFVALKSAGCEVEFARYPGASHLFLFTGRPEQRVDFLTRTLGWFKDHLGEPT